MEAEIFILIFIIAASWGIGYIMGKQVTENKYKSDSEWEKEQ